MTSAVIYASLLGKLSGVYSFMSLGGTSAGAVAAAAGAIAERSRRTHGDRLAFDALAGLPAAFGATDAQGRTALFKLFQPQRATRGGYRVVVAALRHRDGGHWLGTLRRVSWAATWEFPVCWLAGASPGLWFAVGALAKVGSDGWNWQSALSVFLALSLTLVLGAVGALAGGLWLTLRGMLDNDFGLCSGMPSRDDDGEALTPRLHSLYNGLARRPATDRPVVFGDLWGDAASNHGKREIDLQMITTVLNLKRPMRLPNEPGTDPLQGFFYDPDEWERLFPAEVMAWLSAHRRGAGLVHVTSNKGRELWSLPEPENWPVVMAVRLSLSFPGLLSAVPMYTRDDRFDGKPDASERGGFKVEKVYFSDGGITSNCPITLFDAPLPQWPTFGVNLWQVRGAVDAAPQVWMHPEQADPELRIEPFHQRGAIGAAIGFVFQIVGTALDWRDSVQRALPGYAERIVHVGLPPNAGGLNLLMTEDDITRLGVAGSAAADTLVAEFYAPRTEAQVRPNGWDVHRWLRMRSTLTATQRHLSALNQRTPLGQPAYRRWPSACPRLSPSFVDDVAAAEAQALMDGVAELLAKDDGLGLRGGLARNTPEPAPRLRMSSPW